MAFLVNLSVTSLSQNLLKISLDDTKSKFMTFSQLQKATQPINTIVMYIYVWLWATNVTECVSGVFSGGREETRNTGWTHLAQGNTHHLKV